MDLQVCSLCMLQHSYMRWLLGCATSLSWAWVHVVAGLVSQPSFPQYPGKLSSTASAFSPSVADNKEAKSWAALTPSVPAHPHSHHQGQFYRFALARYRTRSRLLYLKLDVLLAADGKEWEGGIFSFHLPPHDKGGRGQGLLSCSDARGPSSPVPLPTG